MKFDIGKVKEFNGYTGKIVTALDTYVFFDTDIEKDNTISVNDYVLFRGEVINDVKRAYFVKFFSKEINNVHDIKSKLERALRKEDNK